MVDFDRSTESNTWAIPEAFLVTVGIVFIMIQSLHSGSTPTFHTAVLFMLMYTAAIVTINFVKTNGTERMKEYLNVGADTAQKASFAGFLGFTIFYSLKLIGGLELFSIVASLIPSMPLNSIVLSVGSALPQPYSYFFNGIVAPIVEESFFGIVGGTMLVFIFSELDIGNRFVEDLLAALVLGVLFASFHVDAPLLSAFWIASFLFRFVGQSIMSLDLDFNIVPGIAVFISFLEGAHLANNIFELGGLIHFMTVLFQAKILFILTVVVAVIYLYWSYRFADEWGSQKGWSLSG